ncbi:MAG: hypothetical protein OXF50_08845 [Caldilineaceae bacterium]|nr:hypothetical protein [Caldilineaceae bacterium]
MHILTNCFVLILVGSWTAAGCTSIAIEAGKAAGKEVGKAAAKKVAKEAASAANREATEATKTPTPTASTVPQVTLEVSPSPQPVSATPTPSPHAVLQVAAQEIIDDYDENRPEADEKYEGVVLKVFGEIARVKKDDVHYIIFHIEGGPDNVRCNLAPGQVDEWARLNKGDRVVVVGTGVGKNRGPWGDFNLDACTLNTPSG